MPQAEYTIAEAAARCGLPESTLRYWERIGLIRGIARNESSRHRRYTADDITVLETLSNLRAVGLSVEDMRSYLASARHGDNSAKAQRELFEAHAKRLADEVATLELRRRYLDLKVQYWSARERGNLEQAEAVASELSIVIRHINPKESA